MNPPTPTESPPPLRPFGSGMKRVQACSNLSNLASITNDCHSMEVDDVMPPPRKEFRSLADCELRVRDMSDLMERGITIDYDEYKRACDDYLNHPDRPRVRQILKAADSGREMPRSAFSTRPVAPAAPSIAHQEIQHMVFQVFLAAVAASMFSLHLRNMAKDSFIPPTTTASLTPKVEAPRISVAIPITFDRTSWRNPEELSIASSASSRSDAGSFRNIMTPSSPHLPFRR